MLNPNHLEVRLEPDATAPGKARSAAYNTMVDIDAATTETALLLVSELVTNSVRHAGLDKDDAVILCILQQPRRLRVEVQDAGAGFDHQRRASSRKDPGGWGLYLVEQLSQRWGVKPGNPSMVWFELDLVD